MKNKAKNIKQVRVTVPKWIADLKEWDCETHLEIVPQTDNNDKPITPDVTIIIKEIKKHG